jgi:hypothetical protein
MIFLISIAIRKDSVKTTAEKPKVDYKELTGFIRNYKDN